MQRTAPPLSPDTGKPRRTEPKQVRRRQLIEATIDSIAKYGIAGTTMSTVTDIAGLSIGLVNFHFQSKQNLLEETLKFLAREHHDHWRRAYEDAGLSARDKLLAIVDSHFHSKICTRRKLAVWYAFFGEAGRRTVYRALVDAIDDERFALSLGLCQQITDEGGYPRHPVTTIARTLEGLYDGLWLNILMYPETFDRDAARANVHAYLALAFPRHFELPQQATAGRLVQMERRR
ncbi:MAG: transcriptional regulator [Roseovarius sp. BRH_c41]|jgi:TetR/AcrR family transcriptional repressor of bet genes|uniref:TetR family transcriptional regulator C-terminal domain-containing protein n=1 Tax=Roseovarius sp. BRH_c41 TaxID=1629709 RepID=UPI0005F245BD|nr:TetR family transcriptional regulator C-terminal domain-containing protein [Roseovarius sp. BRH_c41]KJS43930.1 MAG: transcriptional regulator [Roseovarius sp. BRH_c41]